MPFPNKKLITAAQQYFALKHGNISKQGSGMIKRDTLMWQQCVFPTPLSRPYQIRIVYHVTDAPKVYVDQPELKELAGNRKLPHVYSEDPVQLCLYLPKSGQWTKQQLIVDTILPWTVLWLYYFEMWLISGEWHGGGEHPNGREQDE